MADDVVKLARRVEEAWNASDMDAIDELIAPDLVAHTPGADQLPPGLEGAQAAHHQSRVSFPDFNVTVLDAFGEGDRAVVRCRATGTNTGGVPAFGTPPNDRSVDFEWMSIYRFENAKLVESWAIIDLVALLTQLGVMPGSEG